MFVFETPKITLVSRSRESQSHCRGQSSTCQPPDRPRKKLAKPNLGDCRTALRSPGKVRFARSVVSTIPAPKFPCIMPQRRRGVSLNGPPRAGRPLSGPDRSCRCPRQLRQADQIVRHRRQGELTVNPRGTATAGFSTGRPPSSPRRRPSQSAFSASGSPARPSQDRAGSPTARGPYSSASLPAAPLTGAGAQHETLRVRRHGGQRDACGQRADRCGLGGTPPRCSSIAHCCLVSLPSMRRHLTAPR